jgi:hypothetical protein
MISPRDRSAAQKVCSGLVGHQTAAGPRTSSVPLERLDGRAALLVACGVAPAVAIAAGAVGNGPKRPTSGFAFAQSCIGIRRGNQRRTQKMD